MSLIDLDTVWNKSVLKGRCAEGFILSIALLGGCKTCKWLSLAGGI